MRYFVILIFAVIGLGLGWGAINYSSAATEYSCHGMFYDTNHRGERDGGRLRIDNFRWWVSLWNSNTDGLVDFASKHMGHFFSSKIRNGRSGHFSMYMNLDDDKRFIFRRATGRLAIKEAGRLFAGTCKAIIGHDQAAL
jgi:hypothetical protein